MSIELIIGILEIILIATTPLVFAGIGELVTEKSNLSARGKANAMKTPIKPTAELIAPKFRSGLSLFAILPAQVAATAPSANPAGILKNIR